MFLVHLFTLFIYQPFFNVLLFFYWLDSIVTRGHPDMGIAVIFLTIVIRILLLPMSLAEDKSEKERRGVYRKLQEIQEMFKHDPIMLRQESKKLFRRNKKVVGAEVFSFFVQAMIALMLWKIFSTGLEGQDIHLIYSFMPHIDFPYNLVFLGVFDLSRSNLLLNILQSFMIFLVETAHILTSPYPPQKGEVVRLELVLPIVSFVIFLLLPAGKKLFVITTLVISLLITIYKFIRRRIQDRKIEKEEKAKMAEEAAMAQRVQDVGTTQYVKVGEQLYPVQQLNQTSSIHEIP